MMVDNEEQGRLPTSTMGFIDDVNKSTYGTGTKENFRGVEKSHKQCETWVRSHRSTFAPKNTS